MANDNNMMTRREMRAATVLALIILCFVSCVFIYKSCSSAKNVSQTPMEFVVITDASADSAATLTKSSKSTHGRRKASKKTIRKSTYTPPPTRDHRNEPIN